MDYTIHRTENYIKWFDRLKDKTTKVRILARLHRAEGGNFGDFNPLTDNLCELKFTFGGGIRIYYTVKETQIILLLNGGDKSSQVKDIKKAKQLLTELE